ncbi:hypothetical protein [Castellaniella sp.]|uniref:hypothetical protein n=1 Tax=Castellaniella sp. TaxID=1955812 RepID=UPI00355EE20D
MAHAAQLRTSKRLCKLHLHCIGEGLLHDFHQPAKVIDHIVPDVLGGAFFWANRLRDHLLFDIFFSLLLMLGTQRRKGRGFLLLATLLHRSLHRQTVLVSGGCLSTHGRSTPDSRKLT